MMLAHIAGIPVEETVLQLVPAMAVGAGAIAFAARERLRALRVRAAARVRRVRHP